MLMVATKVDLDETYEKKCDEMYERIQSAERERLQAIMAAIHDVKEDEEVVQGAQKLHRLTRAAAVGLHSGLGVAVRKRKQELRRLSQTRPKLLFERIFPVSACTGQGSEELKTALEAAAVKENFWFFGQEIPRPDLRLECRIEELRQEGVPHLGWDVFQELAKSCDVQARHLSDVTSGLFRRGKILHFASSASELDKALAKTVFINPQWLVNVLKQVARHDLCSLLSEEENEYLAVGLMRRTVLRRLWQLQDLPEHLLDALEALVIQFELMLPLSTSSEYLVPAYLPAKLDDGAYFEWAKLSDSCVQVGCRLEFAFGIPPGFFERLLVRLIRMLRPLRGQPVCWKSGLLCKGNPWVLVQLVPHGSAAAVEITGRYSLPPGAGSRAVGKARNLDWIEINKVKYPTFELLTEWPGVFFNVKVPCPSCSRLGRTDGSAWAIEEFMHVDGGDGQFVHCDVCKQDVPLADLTSPLTLEVAHLPTLKKIASKWKGFQRHLDRVTGESSSNAWRTAARKGVAAMRRALAHPQEDNVAPVHESTVQGVTDEGSTLLSVRNNAPLLVHRKLPSKKSAEVSTMTPRVTDHGLIEQTVRPVHFDTSEVPVDAEEPGVPLLQTDTNLAIAAPTSEADESRCCSAM